MANSAKNVEGVIPADSPIMEPPTVPLVMDMVQRSNGNGAAISIVDLVNRSDGEENVVGLIDAPNDNGSGDGDVTNGEGGHKHKSFGSVATDEAPRSKDNGNGKDDTDAWPSFGSRSTAHSSSAIAPPSFGPVIRMPVARDSEVYNMNHPRRGIAIIFNHMNFDQRLGLKKRNGTDVDRDSLRSVLKGLDFEVKVYNDLHFKQLERVLEEVACYDHTDADCIFVAVLSHGEMGILYASDQPFKPDRLWCHFNAEKCPTLAAKPKLFFIQACQGDQLDGGVRLHAVAKTETDSNAHTYKIPSHADFLIAYSTIPGFYSWRNTSNGSWFVQALCKELNSETAAARDLLSILTRVSRRVALDFQSNTPGDYMMHERKQIPCITSMLTRDIYFTAKTTPVGRHQNPPQPHFV